MHKIIQDIHGEDLSDSDHAFHIKNGYIYLE